MTALTVRRVGNSLGVVLPKTVLAQLRVEEGDHLFVQSTSAGITLSKQDDTFAKDMELARTIMRKRAAVLRELAK